MAKEMNTPKIELNSHLKEHWTKKGKSKCNCCGRLFSKANE